MNEESVTWSSSALRAAAIRFRRTTPRRPVFVETPALCARIAASALLQRRVSVGGEQRDRELVGGLADSGARGAGYVGAVALAARPDVVGRVRQGEEAGHRGEGGVSLEL